MKIHGRRRMILKVIPKPEPRTRAVLVPKKGMLPVIKGDDDLDLLCGKCKKILVKGILEGQIENIVIRCPNCKAYNEILFHTETWEPKFPE